MADFYFDTPEECCSLFANDDGSCTIVDVCADGDGVQPDDTGDGGNNDVVVGEGVCEDLKFHPNHQTGEFDTSSHSCTRMFGVFVRLRFYVFSIGLILIYLIHFFYV